MRHIKAHLLLAENIRTLLFRRHIDAGALAAWCGHSPPWISKILSGGRGVQIRDLGRIADFFGLTVAELFQHGISEMSERRKADRRISAERRTGKDRRESVAGRLHPDLVARFPPPRRDFIEDDATLRRYRRIAARKIAAGAQKPPSEGAES